jgi:hypothetical protein
MEFKIILSGSSNGVTLRNVPREQAKEIFNSVIGAEGLTRLCVVPEVTEKPKKEQTKVQTQALQSKPTTLDLDIGNLFGTEATKAEKQKDKIEANRFYEIKPIHHSKLIDELALPIPNMSYFDLGAVVVVCLDENRLYTTWSDIERLPYPVPTSTIDHLSKHKQTMVRKFRGWINDGKPAYDPDANFRKILNTDTRPTGKIEYDAEVH